MKVETTRADREVLILLLIICFLIAFGVGYLGAQEPEDDPGRVIASGPLHEVTHSLSPTFWVGDKLDLGQGNAKYPPAITVEESSISYTILSQYRGEPVEIVIRRPRKLRQLVR